MSQPSSRRSPLAAAIVLLFASLAHGQSPDPSGHWVGSVQIPGREAAFELDLARGAGGGMTGAFSVGDAHGVPLQKVAVDGRSITFYSRADQPLIGTLSEDGVGVSGEATVSGYSLPFTMTRTGEARSYPPVESDAVSRELEGTWNGTLQAGGLTLRAVLTVTNRPGGKAIGQLVSVDEGGLTLPVVIVQNGSRVSYEQRGVTGSYSGTLSADATELAGTFTSRGVGMPLTFRRAAR